MVKKSNKGRQLLQYSIPLTHSFWSNVLIKLVMQTDRIVRCGLSTADRRLLLAVYRLTLLYTALRCVADDVCPALRGGC